MSKLSEAMIYGDPIARNAAIPFIAPTASKITNLNFPANVGYLKTTGYYSIGDGGGALYKRVSVQPTHAAKLQSLDGAWWELAENVPHLRMFGAKGDGSTNDTTAVQNAINYANQKSSAMTTIVDCRGGIYAVGQLTPLTNVCLWGGGEGLQGTRYQSALFYANYLTAGQAMFSQSSAVRSFSMVGLYLKGNGSGAMTQGVNMSSATECRIISCGMEQWGGECVVMGGGNNRIEHCFMQGLFNSAYLTQQRGTITLSGADHQVSHNEFSGPSQLAVTSSNLYAAAALFTFYDGLITENVFQTGDIGLVALTTRGRYVGNRCDTNAGHGRLLNGIENTFVGTAFARNSYSLDNNYDDSVCTTGGKNICSAEIFWNNSGGGNARYRITDTLTSYPWTNRYHEPTGEAGGTGFYNVSGNSAVGISVSTAPIPLATGATPSVLNCTNFTTANSSTTSITNFVDGFNGQRITVSNGDSGNTTIVNNNSLIQTLTGLNVVVNSTPLEFIRRAGVWYQLGSSASTASAIATPPVMDLMDLNYQAGTYGRSAGEAVGSPLVIPGYVNPYNGNSNAAYIPWAPTGDYIIFVSGVTPASTTNFPNLFSMDDTTANNVLFTYYGVYGGNPSLIISAAVNGVSNTPPAYAIAASTAFKLVIAVTPTQFRYSVNGSSVVTSAVAGGIPASRFLLGYKYNLTNAYGALPTRFRVMGTATSPSSSFLQYLST